MKSMRGIRIMRYILNREQPEPELYDPVERYVRNYPIQVAMSRGDILAAAPHIPNVMFSDFHKANEDSPLWTPKNPSNTGLLNFYLSQVGMWPMAPAIQEEISDPSSEEEFEVNMMEALVGWRGWRLTSQGFLSSINDHDLWMPEKPIEARCAMGKRHKNGSPIEHCSCGVYAVNLRERAPIAGDIFGEVYGWGRYVRGEDGWRSQYAYPKCFTLEYNDAELIEPLKKYHVPIYIEQPTLIYNPEEDGYEYRRNEANGNFGTTEEPAASKEDDSDEDD